MWWSPLLVTAWKALVLQSSALKYCEGVECSLSSQGGNDPHTASAFLWSWSGYNMILFCLTFQPTYEHFIPGKACDQALLIEVCYCFSIWMEGQKSSLTMGHRPEVNIYYSVYYASQK